MCSMSYWSFGRTSTQTAFPSFTILMASSRMMRRAASFGSVTGGGACVGVTTVGAGVSAGVAVVGGAGFVLYWAQTIEAKSIDPAAVMSHLRMRLGLLRLSGIETAVTG